MDQPLEFYIDGGYTKRYHGQRLIMEDTVGQHSYNVAHIILHILPDASAKLLRAALKHDSAEHKVGDMPAPTKRNLPDYVTFVGAEGPMTVLPTEFKRKSFREEFGEYEQSVAEEYGADLEQDLPPLEAWVLKIADSLDGMRFCLQERKMGNTFIEGVFNTFKAYARVLLETAPVEVAEVLTKADEVFWVIWREWKRVAGE